MSAIRTNPTGNDMPSAPTVFHTPGNSTSLGDLSRKLAKAYGRPDWHRIAMRECDAWHGYSAALLADLYERDRANPRRPDLN